MIPRLGAVVALLAGSAAAQEPYAQALGSGAVRYFQDEAAFKATPYSFALELQKRPTFPVPGDFPIKPAFSERDSQRIVTISVPEGSSLYGLGLAPGPMLRNGFHDDAPVECPWVLGVRPDGTAFGVLMDTSYACRVDLTTFIEFRTLAPHPAVIVFSGATPVEVVTALGEITGRAEMPPRWAIGAGIEPRELSPGVARRVRDSGLSADYLVAREPINPLSTGGEPDPRWTEAAQEREASHLKLVARAGVALKESVRTPLIDSGRAIDAWVKDAQGQSAAGEYLLPDFTRAAVRTWWSGAVTSAAGRGLDGLILMPTGLRLAADAVLSADQEFGGPGDGARYGGWLNTQSFAASREGFQGERRDRRPVVIDIGFAGPRQRWASSQVVTGSGADLHLPTSELAGAISLSLSGQPMAVFRPQGDASDGDAATAVGIAACMPMCYFGGMSFDAEAPPKPASALHAALSRRAQLIPYLYTQAFYAFRECQPIVRPLFFADPKDRSLAGRDDAFLLGPDLVVVPAGQDAGCPLRGGWRRVELGDAPNLPALYLRPGAILPIGPAMQWTSEKPIDPLTLVINLDPSGVATGSLYDDSGDGYAFYRNQCQRLAYRAELKDGAVFVRLAGLDGGLPMPRRKLLLRILTDHGEVAGSGSERGTVRVELP